MHDDELDTLLLQAKPEPTLRANRSAQDLATSIAAQHEGTSSHLAPPSKKRKRWVLPAIGIGALALTAGGSLKAYELSIPPFVTTEDGDARTAKVPIDFVTHDGTPVSCGGYLDYQHLSDTQTQQLKAFVSNTNWEGFGQQHYNALPAATRNAQGQDPDAAAASALNDIVAMAQKKVPGLGYLKVHSASISASIYNCTYPNGAPK